MPQFHGSADAALEVNYQFQVFATDENGHLRTPTPVENNDDSYFFEGAVENFQARFADFDFDEADVIPDSGFESEGNQAINITKLFAERAGSNDFVNDDSIGERDEESNSTTEPDPLTLDLTTDLVNDDMGRRINYIIDGDELNELQDNIGVNISELTLFIRDADVNTPGFQLDQDQNTNDFEIFSRGEVIDTNIPQEATIIKENDIHAALHDIEFILANDLLGSITGFEVTVGDSSIVEGENINRGSIIIPNSDDFSRFAYSEGDW